jgi:hypothetical protein
MFPPVWSILLVALLHVTQGSVATYIDLHRRSGHLQKRNSTSGLVFNQGGYYINVTMGGNPYSVMIDTGRWATDITYCRRSAHSPTRFPALTFGSRVPCLTLPPRPLLPRSNMPSVRIQVCTLVQHARSFSSRYFFPRPSLNGGVGHPWFHSSESSI